MKLLLSKTDPKLGVHIGEARDALAKAQGHYPRGGTSWKVAHDAMVKYSDLCVEIGRLIVTFAIVDEYDSRQSTIEEFCNETSSDKPKEKPKGVSQTRR